MPKYCVRPRIANLWTLSGVWVRRWPHVPRGTLHVPCMYQKIQTRSFSEAYTASQIFSFYSIQRLSTLVRKWSTRLPGRLFNFEGPSELERLIYTQSISWYVKAVYRSISLFQMNFDVRILFQGRHCVVITLVIPSALILTFNVTWNKMQCTNPC